ncbi:hypothetical protein CVT24_006664, partial [Panaeolus cyanescens]
MVNIRQPISTMLKANLVNACRQLRLPTNGTVKALRARLRTFARHHPELAADPRYAGLYPRRRGHGPPSTISANSDSSEDDRVSPEPNADAENHNINDQNAPEDEILNDDDSDREWPEFRGIRSRSNSPLSATTASHRSSTAPSAHNVSVANSRFSTPNNHHERLVSPRPFAPASPPHRSTQSPRPNSPQREVLAEISHNIQPHELITTRRSTRTPGATISNTAYPPPPRFRQYLKNGWTHHIPLTALTDRACANEAMGKNRPRDEFTLTFRTDGSFTVPTSHPNSLQDQQVDEDDEHKISFHQWLQAWRRLLDLIRECLPPLDFSMWQAHHDRIFNDRTLSEYWPVWREYDILVRQQAVYDKKFDPSVFQKDTFAAVERRLRDAENNQRLNSAINAALKQLPKSFRAPSYRNSPPNTDQSSSQDQSYRCLICGSRAHRPKQCDAKFLVNGKPLLLPRPNGQPPYPNRPDNQNVTYCFDAMPVRYAVTHPTTLNPVPPFHHNPIHSNPFFPIVTPFNPDAWHSALSSSNLLPEFSDVINGIRFGFDMGTSSIINTHTYLPPNHKSATLHPSTITDSIKSELLARRYSGPFDPGRLSQIIGHFRSSPLGLVPKADGGFRLIQDFSFPRNNPSFPSVNAYIDLDSFHCNWGTFNKIADIVINAPEGTLIATMDVDSAFRRCPIHPSQRQNFVVHWEGLCYIDHCAPFGAASSGFVFGRVADAFVAILESRGIISVINWVDDFAIPFYPINNPPKYHHSDSTFSHTLETLYQIASELGWPWKHSKTRPPAPKFTYLGFLWDIPNKTVELPPNKKTKYLAKLALWIPGKKFTQREAENLLGTLVHCSLALPSSRTHLPSL